MSYADRSDRSLIAASSSCADLPPYSGAISGWMIDAVPSYAARVAPGFQEVRLGHVPMAQRRRLIVVLAEVNAERDLVQAVRERNVGGRRVDRVAADDDERGDAPGLHVGDQILERLDLIDGVGLDRIGVDERPADVPEDLVEAVNERVHDGRLPVSGDHEASAAVRVEIFRNRVDPRSGRARRRAAGV